MQVLACLSSALSTYNPEYIRQTYCKSHPFGKKYPSAGAYPYHIVLAPEAERDPIASPPCTNVDHFGASLLNAIFDRSLHTATFGAARSVGYGLHALESSKKPRLVRPLGLYVGPNPDLVLTDSEKSTPVKNSLDFTVWQKEPNVVTTFAPTMSMSMNPKDEQDCKI